MTNYQQLLRAASSSFVAVAILLSGCGSDISIGDAGDDRGFRPSHSEDRIIGAKRLPTGDTLFLAFEQPLGVVMVGGEPDTFDVTSWSLSFRFGEHPFQTWTPRDFTQANQSTWKGNASTYRQALYREGAREEGELEFYLPADSVVSADSARVFAAAKGADRPHAEAPGWSLVSFEGGTADERVEVHQIDLDGQPVYITLRYPASDTEPLGPQLKYVLDNIVWSDTDEKLIDG